MGAKGKNKTKKKGKKPKEEPEPEDDYRKMDGETLEKNMASLKEKLVDAKIKRNMLQMEKDMIHDFYHNTRSEIKEIEARIKNFDSDMQELEKKQRSQIKCFMQKVKHLEYENGISSDTVIQKAQDDMRNEKEHHKVREKEMLK